MKTWWLGDEKKMNVIVRTRFRGADKARLPIYHYYSQVFVRTPQKTITDADYADDIAILANTPNQAETLLHCLERAAAGIGLHVNAHKTEYMCFNQTSDISTLEGISLKLVDKFTYRGKCLINQKKTSTRGQRRHGRLSISYRLYGNITWPRKWNAVSYRQWSYGYYCMDAPLGRLQNDWRIS